jgi:excisionase family DNA binding protein
MSNNTRFVAVSPPSQILVNVAEARAILRIGSQQLYQLARIGAIPSVRCGRSLRFVPAELEAWARAGCPRDPGAAESIRRGLK